MTAQARWRQLLADEDLPQVIVDLDVVDQQLRALSQATGAAHLRLDATALPCPGLLRYLLQAGAPRTRGLAVHSVVHAALLVELGFDDILVTWPVGRPRGARQIAALVAQGHRVIASVDSARHVQLIAAHSAGVPVPLCAQLDLSGATPRRSPITDSELARVLVQIIANTDGVEFIGVSDMPPGAPRGGSRARRRAREVSLDRRRAVLETLHAAGQPPRIFNAEADVQADDPSLTEITVGRQLLLGTEPGPALLQAFEVVSVPDPEQVLCAVPPGLALGAIHQPPATRALGPPIGPHLSPIRLLDPGTEIEPGTIVITPPQDCGACLDGASQLLMLRDDSVVERALTLRGLGG